jgi:hypothetical protein
MSDELEIKAGDIVRVKASAIKMTVERTIISFGKTEADVVWFDEEYHLHKARINTAALSISS